VCLDIICHVVFVGSRNLTFVQKKYECMLTFLLRIKTDCLLSPVKIKSQIRVIIIAELFVTSRFCDLVSHKASY